MNNVYVENGYENRKEYLSCLADDYGLPFETVLTLANLYGQEEDFDALVVAVEDMAEDTWG